MCCSTRPSRPFIIEIVDVSDIPSTVHKSHAMPDPDVMTDATCISAVMLAAPALSGCWLYRMPDLDQSQHGNH